jgi:hypothetical protein
MVLYVLKRPVLGVEFGGESFYASPESCNRGADSTRHLPYLNLTTLGTNEYREESSTKCMGTPVLRLRELSWIYSLVSTDFSAPDSGQIPFGSGIKAQEWGYHHCIGPV